MFQLTYAMKDADAFTHQISQLGAHFVSKGPAKEIYFKSTNHQLRLNQGMQADLVLVKCFDHYQEIIEVPISQDNQLRDLLSQALEEQAQFTKQVIRYYLKNVLIEIHRYETNTDLIYLQAETLNKCKDLARQLSLSGHDRIDQTPASLFL